MLQTVTLALGGLLTIAGAGLLVVAFRHGQARRADEERRVFRYAVGCLAAGSALFLVTTVTSGA
ncbi:hypothetical protein [Actinotalea sp. C106]|uniref:hypothetical protein n=1 Tax=Actinotalea sp. C106 TaxID=2908644 RepID=UPI002027FEF7|nr:hypothetical protein [Actinotalea sp. C106]